MANLNLTLAEKKELYIVLTHVSDEGRFYITHRSNFGVMNECESFDSYGQKVGCYNAGCYSFDNSCSSIFGDFIGELGISELLSEKDISAWDFCRGLLVEDTEDLVEMWGILGGDIDTYKGKIKEFKETNENHVECTGWDYWDGSNWKTVVIGSDCDWSEADEKETDLILSGYDGALDVFSGASASEVVGNWEYTTTRYANDPWLATVEAV